MSEEKRCINLEIVKLGKRDKVLRDNYLKFLYLKKNMTKSKKLNPNQAIIILGSFLTLGGLISLILNYWNSDDTSSFVSSVFLLLMGIIVIFLGIKTKT